MCSSWISVFFSRVSLLWTILWITNLAQAVLGLPGLIRIGGLFDDTEDASIENAFRYAIFRINHDNQLLSRTKLSFDIQHLRGANSFVAAKSACNQAGLGVAAIFGPRTASLASHINSMCNSLELPHIEARLEPQPDPTNEFSVNLYPDSAQLSKAFLHLVEHFSWTRFCVLYASETDLLLLQDVIRAPVQTEGDILVRQVTRETLRETLKDLEKKGITKYIAQLDTEDTHFLLKVALQQGMIDSKHHFILTNLDLETIDLEDFYYNYVNLTGVSLINKSRGIVQDTLHQMALHEKGKGGPLLNGTDVIKTEAALMYDAVYTLASGLQMAEAGTPLRLVNLTCELDKAWAFGSSLYNYLNLVNTDAGLTGRIKFYQGRRVDFSLDILQLVKQKLTKIGEWTAEHKVVMTGNTVIPTNSGFTNKTLIVTSILEPPYVMEKESEQILIGNDKYEGFCIDLLYEIAEKVGFKYKIVLVPDKKYGTNNEETGEWNGMVGEILYKRADLAVASLSISYLREMVIDFTKPYMNLGISILFKRPKRESPGLFSFLNPLAIEIWLYVIAAYFVVSLVMFIVARFSPYEWYNPHPCNPETDVVENVFTLSNSFWFAVGTLMQQGSDINPKAVSTRIVGGIWWFFTLIIISSYTANLAAFLTVERMVSPIESAEDLSKQTNIAYGTLMGGSTMTFFRESRIPTYQRMWHFMDGHEPSVFVKNSQEGIDRVSKGMYAFLMESTMIDYQIQRNCDLMQVGGLLDSKDYGIGTPEDSPYRDMISMAILSLQEDGRIQMLYNKWWKNTGTCNHDDKTQDKANSLGVANVGGIFVVLFVGLAIAILIAVAEFLWNSRKNSHREHRSGMQRSIWSEMLEELRFAIRCHGSTTKPALRRECSKCLHYTDQYGGNGVESHNGIVMKELGGNNIQPSKQLNHRELAHREHLLHRDGPVRYNVEDVTYRDYGSHT